MLDRKHALNITLSIPGLDLDRGQAALLYGLLVAEDFEAGDLVVRDLRDPTAFVVLREGAVKIEGVAEEKTLTAGDYLGAGHLPTVDSPRRGRSLAKPFAAAPSAENPPPPPSPDEEAPRARARTKVRTYRLDLDAARKAIDAQYDERRASERASDESEGDGRARPEDLLVGRTLGTGTFGRVKLCTDTAGRPYALKMLLKEAMIAMDQTHAVAYEREVLERLDHPFVLFLHSVFHSRDVCYFLLEYVPGGELFSHIQDRGMAEKEALFFGAHVLDALEHVHAADVVFRDLKPENVLIDERGYARIVDFGFAKFLGQDERTYTILGTPEYLSPECVLGQGYRFDVDLWAFGVLVYEMLRGRSPFCPRNPDDTMAVFRLITAAVLKIPKSMNAPAGDLVTAVLRRDKRTRLGEKAGAADIKADPIFDWLGGDWERLRAKECEAPYVPDLASDADSSKFDSYPENMDITPFEGDQTAFYEFGNAIVDDPESMFP